MASESEIQAEILEYLAATVPEWKGFFYRTGRRTGKSKWKNPERDNGQPDITGNYRTYWVGFEVKDATGKLLNSQKAFRDRVEAIKGDELYFVVRSVEDVEAALKHIESRVGESG